MATGYRIPLKEGALKVVSNWLKSEILPYSRRVEDSLASWYDSHVTVLMTWAPSDSPLSPLSPRLPHAPELFLLRSLAPTSSPYHFLSSSRFSLYKRFI